MTLYIDKFITAVSLRDVHTWFGSLKNMVTHFG